MSDSTNQFRVVLRGYDPTQVDRRVHELTEVTESAREQIRELSLRIQEIEREQAEAGDQQAQPVSFVHLGERVGQILSLAEDEAVDLRGRAQAEVEAAQKQAHEASARDRDESDRYAEQRRSNADTEAARMLEDARRTSDDLLDTAERDAAARLQEAEAVYESQRAKAAKAAADFETTLAKRRERVEQEFTEQMAVSQQQLEAAEDRTAQVRTDAEQMHSDASREARGLVEAAQEQSEGIIREAKTLAARIRAESERELDAATQRRDSINAQLSNVRQMLATLSGAAPGAFLGHGLDEEPAPSPPEGDEVDALETDESAAQMPAESQEPADQDEQVNR